jgi:hypothetical protein
MADVFDDMEHLHGSDAANGARQATGMRPVPGQAIMGNKLQEQGSTQHMQYGPLEGVPGPGGKNYFSQYPNSKYRSRSDDPNAK